MTNVVSTSGVWRLGSRLRTGVAFGVTAIILSTYWGGCSVSKHYETLSKFFDGVPDPNAVVAQNGRPLVESANYSEHEPYTDDSCLECHTSPSEMLLPKDDSTMCLSCHTEITEQYPVMHGAVAGMACLWCHNPHYSQFEFLLRQEAPDLCLQCHSWGTMESPTPPHQDLEQDCLECHFGHGGDQPAFLRDSFTDERYDSPLEQPGNINGP